MKMNALFILFKEKVFPLRGGDGGPGFSGMKMIQFDGVLKQGMVAR